MIDRHRIDLVFNRVLEALYSNFAGEKPPFIQQSANMSL